MKRYFSIFFLLLYFYNFTGYLVIFALLRYNVKSEMRQQLKENVPESELTVLRFHTLSLEHDLYPVQWMDRNEFRYGSEMYDIVRSYVTGDTTFFVALNDRKETSLLANLEAHVNQHMGGSETQSRLDAFKEVFTDSFPHVVVYAGSLTLTGFFACINPATYLSVNLEVPFLPPRTSSNA